MPLLTTLVFYTRHANSVNENLLAVNYCIPVDTYATIYECTRDFLCTPKKHCPFSNNYERDLHRVESIHYSSSYD